VIGSLRGQLVNTRATDALIDVGGVGYRVVATASTLSALRDMRGEVTVSVYTHVREDALVLYGFVTDQEREVFEILLGTHGVGPSLAMAIVGTLGAQNVVRAVHEGDAGSFEQVAGVGKKTAARLVLELQGSLGEGFEPAGAPASAMSTGVRADIAAALDELGYSSEEIRVALGELDGSEGVEQGIRRVLKAMSRS
jgi:Holliday junction DNA helicase RuvA